MNPTENQRDEPVAWASTEANDSNPNPYHSPDALPENRPTKHLRYGDYFSFVVFPPLLFCLIALLANQNSEKISVPTYPIINLDRWTQARLQMVLIVAGFWLSVLVLNLIGERKRFRNRIGLILGWNILVVGLALAIAYFKFPDWLP